MRVVIDTNILVASLSSKSKYHWIIQALREGRFELCVTEDIYLEYEEVLKQKYNVIVANSFLNSLKELSNVIQIDIFYKWLLIPSDPDDDKFVDCAVAGNVDFLITNDKHYNILKTIGFPPINVISLDEFEEICWGGLKEQIIKGRQYQIEVKSNSVTIICKYNKSPIKYSISKNDLIAVNNDGSMCSNLIEHLSDKKWVAKDITLLYDLAELTKKSFPLSGIDWETTFFNVAFCAYTDRLHNEDNKSLFDSVMNKLRDNINESLDMELMKNLKEGVREELKKRNII